MSIWHVVQVERADQAASLICPLVGPLGVAITVMGTSERDHIVRQQLEKTGGQAYSNNPFSQDKHHLSPAFTLGTSTSNSILRTCTTS